MSSTETKTERKLSFTAKGMEEENKVEADCYTFTPRLHMKMGMVDLAVDSLESIRCESHA